jgi:hypothetical protein
MMRIWLATNRGLIKSGCAGSNAEQYFVNKLSCVFISIIQRVNLCSIVIGDMVILRRDITLSATGMCQNLLSFRTDTFNLKSILIVLIDANNRCV